MMSIHRQRNWKSYVVPIFFGAFVLVMVSLLAPGTGGVAAAAAGAGLQTGGQKVAVFDDVTIGPDDYWHTVVVIGGDLVVEGTVENGVVVVGGDLTVRAGSSVGRGPSSDPAGAAIVSVFGDITIDPGADISGRVVDVAGGVPGGLRSVFVDPLTKTWSWVSTLTWILSTFFLLIVAVIISAIAPRQVAYVRERVRRHFFSSLGWGALGIPLVPLITALLFATVIGILFVLPWLFVALPVMLLFGAVSVAALIGGSITGRGGEQRGRMILAAVVGMAVLCVFRWVPIAGAVVLFLAFLIGFGATYTSIWQWRREARERKAQTAALPTPRSPRPRRPVGGL